MMEAVWLALIVAGGALLTTIVNAWLIRKSKREDYARQDLVADRLTKRQDAVAARAEKVAIKAEEAAKLLLAAQRASITRTDEVARVAATTAAKTAAKLDAIEKQGNVIHTLVNQKLTTVTEQALSATQTLLTLLEEAIAQSRAGGVEPTPADLERLSDTRKSIVDLRATLATRAEQQAQVEADQGGTT